MTGKSLIAVLVFAALAASAGCVTPVVGAPDYGGRSALMQLGIARAADQAFEEPKLKALSGRKVWVDIACISRATTPHGGRAESEDVHFIKNLIVEKLVENNALIVERDKADAVLRGVCETIGTDTIARVFPHTYLPLMYYISHTARVKVRLYAYDVADAQRIMTSTCEGSHSWGEWSAFGLGPFRH